MRQATVTISAEGLADRGFDVGTLREAGVRDLSVFSCEGFRGVLRVRVADRLEPDRLDAMSAVQWWELVAGEDAEYVYLLELAPSDAAGPMPADDEPFPRCERSDLTDEGLRLTWTGRSDHLKAGLGRLTDDGTALSLESIRPYRPDEAPLDRLTDRQRDVLELALDRGYFDVPRGTSIEDLAADLDLNDSTVAEHLQRAERNVVRAVLGE